MTRTLARFITTILVPAVTAAALTLLPAGTAAAQETVAGQEREDRQQQAARWRFEVSLEGLLFDNFFQAPEDAEETTVKGLRGVGRLEFRPDPASPVTLIGGFGRTVYDSGLEDATLLLGGLRVQSRPHDLELLAGYEIDRPILDVGDGLGTADVLFVDGEYGYRLTSDWELKGMLDVQRQDFAIDETDNNTILGVGPAIRYRGFGSGFSPEVGALFGGRSASDPGEDHSQTDLYVKVRMAPSPDLYLSFRLRRRMRDYSVEDVADRNFGREDRRNQLSAVLVYPTSSPLALTAYYAYQDAESTLTSRTFTAQMLFAGVRIAVE